MAAFDGFVPKIGDGEALEHIGEEGCYGPAESEEPYLEVGVSTHRWRSDSCIVIIFANILCKCFGLLFEHLARTVSLEEEVTYPKCYSSKRSSRKQPNIQK